MRTWSVSITFLATDGEERRLSIDGLRAARAQDALQAAFNRSAGDARRFCTGYEVYERGEPSLLAHLPVIRR